MMNNELETANKLWQGCLKELSLVLTRGVFNQHLAGTKVTAVREDGGWDVLLRSEQSVRWMMRLGDTVARVLPDGVKAWWVWEDETAVKAVPIPLSNLPLPSPRMAAKGFPDVESNWTKCPDFFFQHVMAKARGAAFKIVGAVVLNTLGQRDKRGRYREWWQNVSYSDLKTAAGLGSDHSVSVGIWEARAHGWIKRRGSESGNGFDYSLRWEDEPIDFPDSDKPRNGR